MSFLKFAIALAVVCVASCACIILNSLGFMSFNVASSIVSLLIFAILSYKVFLNIESARKLREDLIKAGEEIRAKKAGITHESDNNLKK